jgi:hypothetical protein
MNEEHNSEVRDTLLLAGGLALLVFGAGCIAAHAGVRRALLSGIGPLLPGLQAQGGSDLGGVLPDFERYLKLRAM